MIIPSEELVKEIFEIEENTLVNWTKVQENSSNLDIVRAKRKGEEIQYYKYTPHLVLHIKYKDAKMYSTNSYELINIYEFTFKCKEWAEKQGYDILSARYADAKLLKLGSAEIIEEFSTTTDTEYKEVVDIIKACEYILKIKKENK